MQELSPYFTNRYDTDVNPHFSSVQAFAQDEPHFIEYWRAIAKRWRFIVTLVICTLALTRLVIFFMIPTYTATSSVLIEPQAPQVLDMREFETHDSGDEAEENYYGTQYKILQSRSLAARVIRKLNLQRAFFLSAGTPEALGSGYLDRRDSRGFIGHDEDPVAGTLGVGSRVIDAYLKHLTIRPEPGTRLVTVAFSAPDPVLSARVVNAHVQAYIARGTELHAEASESAVKYLQTKLTELQARVEKSEAVLNAYRRRRGIVDDSSDGNNKVVIGRIIDLNRALTEAETQRITLNAEAQLIATRDYAALPSVANDALIQTLRQQQARIQAEYASMADQYKPNYPPLAELAAQLKDTQSRLDREMHRVAKGVGLSYAAAAEREKELNYQIDQEKDRALALNDASVRDAILARAVETNRKLYKNVLERMTQMGMAAGVSASNVSILDNAAPPLTPSSPKLLLTLASCGVLALLIGISSACFLERFDDTFKDADEVERYVGVPSLAVVPDFRKLILPTYWTKHLLSRLVPARAQAIDTVVVADPDNGFSVATEAYRALRLSLLLSRPGGPPKVILITSGTPGEGKTVTTINTAIVFAQMSGRVLLIDADLRNPRCHKLLGMSNHEGLSECLSGRLRSDEVIHPTSIDGLACITSGSTPLNPGMLLGSSSMNDLLVRLKESYDCILIDSAPVMPVTDTLHLMNMVDGVVLVVGPHVPKRRVKNVCARLNQIHAPLLGIVQNQVDISMQRNGPDCYYPRYHRSPEMNGTPNQIES
jgi:succinoglycan biosynthesis transport protein ExoP